MLDKILKLCILLARQFPELHATTPHGHGTGGYTVYNLKVTDGLKWHSAHIEILVGDEYIQMGSIGRFIATDIPISKSPHTHVNDLTHFIRMRAKTHKHTPRNLESPMLSVLIKPLSRMGIGAGRDFFCNPDTFVRFVSNHLFRCRHDRKLLPKIAEPVSYILTSG